MVFRVVEPGHTVWSDDGEPGGRVERVDADGVFVRITLVKPSGTRARVREGINQGARDVTTLQDALRELGGEGPGILARMQPHQSKKRSLHATDAV